MNFRDYIQLEETFKLKGYTPQRFDRWPLLGLEETFKLRGYTPLLHISFQKKSWKKLSN